MAGEPLLLPLEIVQHIVAFIPHRADSQSTLYATALVSRTWYLATLSRLYEQPRIDSKNFEPFVRTICPSINAHVRKTDLADMVRILDMSTLIHDGSRSLTARIISRLKNNIRVYTAPCTTFSLNSFSALSKCHNLLSLDLSYVTEYVSLDRLFNSISKLPSLTTLHLSRSTASDAIAARLRLTHGAEPDIHSPPNLKHLRISGNTSDQACLFLLAANLSLSSLVVGNCRVDANVQYKLLHQLCSSTITDLTIAPGFLPDSPTDFMGMLCNERHTLRRLRFCEVRLFPYFYQYLLTVPLMGAGSASCLEILEVDIPRDEMLRAPGTPESNTIVPSLLWEAVSESCLGELREVHLRYPSYFVPEHDQYEQEMGDVADLMEALERERAESEGRESRDTGVWIRYHRQQETKAIHKWPLQERSR